MVTNAAENAQVLVQEMDWLARVVDQRLEDYFARDQPQSFDFYTISPPEITATRSCYGQFIQQQLLSPENRLILILALVPFIKPQLLDVFFTKNNAIERGFSEFGGIQGRSHAGFMPTVETALFIIAADNLAVRFNVLQQLDKENPLITQGVLQLITQNPVEPWSSSLLTISREFVSLFTSGQRYAPEYNADFPARHIQTQLGWHHLVLPAATLEQLEEIRHWLQYGQQLLDEWDMRDKLTPGFTSLFYGPPGTGKTLSACLLGKFCQCDVYKVDLSLMVSKYIGETEKNLARVFDAAEHRRWILFFDEADALFGKRTKVDDSHDRYANQEISYLLQRIEEFNGVVILASNLKTNIDDAFIRRFQSIIHFPMPKAAERYKIWQQAFSGKARLHPELKLETLSEQHEISGGTIMNIVRFVSLRSLSRKSNIILKEDMDEGLRREYLKLGRRL
jgi:hypothetical protein